MVLDRDGDLDTLCEPKFPEKKEPKYMLTLGEIGREKGRELHPDRHHLVILSEPKKRQTHIKAKLRRLAAIRLHEQGAGPTQISHVLGITRQHVHRILKG